METDTWALSESFGACLRGIISVHQKRCCKGEERSRLGITLGLRPIQRVPRCGGLADA